MSSRSGPLRRVSHKPMAMVASDSRMPSRRICAAVSTPFWMKRLPPVKGNTRRVLMRSVPLSSS